MSTSLSDAARALKAAFANGEIQAVTRCFECGAILSLYQTGKGMKPLRRIADRTVEQVCSSRFCPRTWMHCASCALVLDVSGRRRDCGLCRHTQRGCWPVTPASLALVEKAAPLYHATVSCTKAVRYMRRFLAFRYCARTNQEKVAFVVLEFL